MGRWIDDKVVRDLIRSFVMWVLVMILILIFVSEFFDSGGK